MLSRRARVLLAGMFVSLAGDKFAAIAFALLAVELDSPNFLVGILLADLVPPIVLGPIGGTVADRFAGRWLWPGVLLTQGAIFAALTIPTSQVAIVVLVAAASTVAAAAGPLGAKYLHAVVDRQSRPLAARRSAQVQATAGVVGTVLGGFTFGLAALDWMLLANACSFVVLGFASLLVGRVVFESDDSADHATQAGGLMYGFRLMWSHRVFGVGLTAVLVGVMFGTSLEGVASPFFLIDDLGLSTGAYGVLIGTWSIGMLTGAAWSRPNRHAASSRLSIVRYAALMGSCLLTLAILQSPIAAFPLYVLGGLANGVFNAGIGVVIFSSVSSGAQGRAWAAFGAVANASVLAGYVAGLALDDFSARWVVAASGIVPLVLCALAVSVTRRGPDRAERRSSPSIR